MPPLFATHPPYARWAHVLLRIIAGAVITQHGAQKIFGVLGGFGHLNGLFWTAGLIELLGGVALMLGLFTRIAGFLLAGEMAVAYFMVHAPKGFWPIQNKGELAVILCFTFLYFTATGAGTFSFDYWRSRNRPKPVMVSG